MNRYEKTAFDFSSLQDHGIERIGELNPYITLACDLRCQYCYMFDFLVQKSDEMQIMKSQYLFSMVDFFSKYDKGLDRLTLLGGEPTLHPKITEIANTIAQFPIKELRMTTNAVGLHNLDLDKLNSNVFSHISVSIDGTSPEINNLTRGNGTFSRILKTIELYRQKGIPLSINYTVTTNNINNLHQVVPFFSDVGVTIVNFHRASLDGNAYHNEHLIVNPTQWVDARSKLIDYLKKEGDNFPNIKVRIPYIFLTPQQVIDLDYHPIQEQNYHSPEGGHRLIVFPPTSKGKGLCYMSADLIGQKEAELGYLDTNGTFIWNDSPSNELTAYRQSSSLNVSTNIKNQQFELSNDGLIRVSHSFKENIITGCSK